MGSYWHSGTCSQSLGDPSKQVWVEENRKAWKMSPGAKIQEDGEDPAKEDAKASTGPGQENT